MGQSIYNNGTILMGQIVSLIMGIYNNGTNRIYNNDI